VNDIRTGAFGRVPECLGNPLTQVEVEALLEGTAIVIIWSGGNGPHEYTVCRAAGRVYASRDPSLEQMRTYNPIDFVGPEHFNTRVWLNPTAST
jgi:hypothetical protein